MSKRWKNLQGSINALSIRERKLIAITIVAVILTLIFLLVWQPLFTDITKSYQANQAAQGQVTTIKGTINSYKNRVHLDVNAPYKTQVKNLKKQIKQQDHKVESLTSALITPRNMGRVFTGLLQNTKMNMNKISNLDASAINITDKQEEINLLYKHGLSLELEGKFLNALNYVQVIERQDWQLYWDELSFSTTNYPEGKLEIEVHTLSTSDSLLDL